MPLCKYGCGEEVQLRQEENGKWNPYSMQLHFRSPVHIAHVHDPKKPKKPKEPAMSEEDQEILEALTFHYGTDKAHELLPLTEGDTVDARILDGIRKADAA